MSLAFESDNELLKNSKFRTFAEELTASLQHFEKARKWPDLVKHMQKVQKVLDKYPSFPALPHKLSFCKRVAQCLNPNLPSGVHLKALQTLDSALNRIGPDRLSRDLSIYSMGLFPLFQYAAMTIKPIMLEIFEKYYLPLNHNLVPCLSGLLIAILPGLEEEGSEVYDRVLKFVNSLEKRLDKTMFYRALWKSVISSPNIRFPTINYLDKQIPIEFTAEDISIYLPDVQTLVKGALKECLGDKELLTQRSTMELLLKHFKISSGIFDEWGDIAVLVVKLVLRKEIALNRRLYNWFIGSEENEFEEYGKKVIISAIQQIFSIPPDSIENATHPFRIMKALLEKQEIGEAIIENVLVSIFYSLHKFKEGHAFSRQLREQVNSLLELVQPEIIWAGAITLFTEDKPDAIGVIDSLIDVIQCDEETQHLHLPNLLSKLLNGIENIGKKGDFEQMYSCLLLARKVFGKFSGISTTLSESQGGINLELIKRLDGLYIALLSYQNVVATVFDNYIIPHFQRNNLGLSIDSLDETQEKRRMIAVLALELLVQIFLYLPDMQSKQITDPTEIVWLRTLRDCAACSDPKISCTAVESFVILIKEKNSGISKETKENIDLQFYIRESTTRLWDLLHSQFSSLHFKVTRVLYDLLKLENKIVNEIISSYLATDNPEEKVEACKRFSILWKLINDRTDSNPLAGNVFLMIDTLSDKRPMIRLAGRTWLAECIPKAERVLEPLYKVLLDPNVVRSDNLYIAPFDTRRIIYVLILFRDIIGCDFTFIPNRVVKPSGYTDLTVLNTQQELHAEQGKYPEYSTSPFKVISYVDMLVAGILRFIQGFSSTDIDGIDDDFTSNVAIVQSTASGLLRYFLTKSSDSKIARLYASVTQDRIARTLYFAVINGDFVFQVQLLRLLKTIITLQEQIPVTTTVSSPIIDSHRLAQQTPPNPNLIKKDNNIQSIVKSPLFIQTLTQGLQQPLSGSVRWYWVDFINTLILYYANDLKIFVSPVTKCLCDIVFGIDNIYAFQKNQEIFVILDSLRNLLSACLYRTEQEIALLSVPLQQEKSGIISSMVGRVFQQDDSTLQTNDPIVEIRKELLSSLPYILKVFIYIWSQSPKGEDEIANKFNAQDRIIKILDPIFINFSNELIYGFSSLIEEYRVNDQSKLSSLFESINSILNAMDSVSSTTIFNDCSVIVSSILKTKYYSKTKIPTSLHEITVVDFAYQFLLKTILPESEISKSQLTFIQLIRTGMISRSPNLYLLMVQLVFQYTNKASLPSDKKQKKDFVDTIFKLVESSLKIANDHSVTISKVNTEKGTLDPKTANRIKGLSLKTIHTLADVVPSLYASISDDKNRTIAPIIHTCLGYLRDHTEHNLPWASVSLLFIINLIENGYSIKLVKREILEIFHDSNFFYMDFIVFSRWLKIINHIMKTSKTSLSDLVRTVQKSLQSHATMVFTTKENENILRARCLKRLAFVIFAGEYDQYSTLVPTIQEILFEALKLSNAQIVQEKVFLCMRVLLLRVSPQKLTSFWPVIVSELMKVCSINSRNVCDPNLILSACKFFDLAVLTDAEQFKVYEWIFIKDYFEFEQKALFVPLVEQIASCSSTESPIKLNVPVKDEKQPLILLRTIEGMEQLSSYLKHYSEAIFTNLVTGGHAVQDILETVIISDFIEFSNIKSFAKTPEKVIIERAKRNMERIDNSLKIESIVDDETTISDDFLLDVNESDDIEVEPGIELNFEKQPPIEDLQITPLREEDSEEDENKETLKETIILEKNDGDE